MFIKLTFAAHDSVRKEYQGKALGLNVDSIIDFHPNQTGICTALTYKLVKDTHLTFVTETVEEILDLIQDAIDCYK